MVKMSPSGVGAVTHKKFFRLVTPEDVREYVLKNCDIFSKGGGFVFNAVHNVQAYTPIDNIVAMFEAVKYFNK